MFAGLAASGAAAVAVTLLSLAGIVRPWHLAVAAFVSGTVWATELSTRRRMIGECAGADQVSRVVALDSLTNSAARIAGPMIGSVAYAQLGLTGAFGISAGFYLVAAALVPGVRHEQAARPLRLMRIPGELAEGFRYAMRQSSTLVVMLVTAVMNLFGFSYTAVVAPLARVGFGVPDAAVGLLAAGEPLGALLGGMLLARRPIPGRPRTWLLAGSSTFVAALLVMPMMPGFGWACLVLVVGGLGLAVFGNVQTSLVLTSTPVALRSRQMGLITVCIGVAPLGQVLIGALTEAMGTRGAVMASATLGLAALAGIWARWGERRGG